MTEQDRPVPPDLHQALAYLLAGIPNVPDGAPQPALPRPPVPEYHRRQAAEVLRWLRGLDPEQFGDLMTDWLAGTPCTACGGTGNTPDGPCVPCEGSGTVKPPWAVYLGYVAAAGSGEIRLVVHRSTENYPGTGNPVVAVAERPRPDEAPGPELCPLCGTDHGGQPEGSFGADVRCLRTTAQAEGHQDLVEALDQLWSERPTLGLLEAVVRVGRIRETLAARRPAPDGGT